MPMSNPRALREVVISTEKHGNDGHTLVKFSARNVVSGKFEPTLQIIGDETELYELVDRLKKRIEDAFRES